MVPSPPCPPPDPDPQRKLALVVELVPVHDQGVVFPAPSPVALEYPRASALIDAEAASVRLVAANSSTVLPVTVPEMVKDHVVLVIEIVP